MKKKRENALKAPPSNPAAWRRDFGIFLLIVCAAFVVRVLFLGRTELWGDEINFANIIANPQYSTWQVFLNYWNYVVAMAQLPLSGVLLNAYMHALTPWFPDVFHSPFLLRLLGIILGSLGAPAIYLTARRFFAPAVKWPATIMAIFFFYPVYYSREVYCYPHLLFFAPWAVYFYLCGLCSAEKIRWRTLAAITFFSTGMVLSHFAGTMLVVAMGLAAAGWWLYDLIGSRDKNQSWAAFWIGAACAAAFVFVAPYWLRVFSQQTLNMYQKCDVPVWKIIHDVVCKMFLGDLFWVAVIAWLLFTTGYCALLRKRTKASVTVAGLLLIGGPLLVWATKNSQYLSARYFSPLMPLFYLIFAQGLWSLAEWIGGRLPAAMSRKATQTIILLCTIIIAAAHVLFFLPDMYRLREKGIPYASVGEWLNQNARPGTPYFFDCGGWDLRYVPGYHPTPRLTPCVSIAWNGPDFDPVKKNIQRQIMNRFPESSYIASPVVPWPEAHQFYRQKQELRNEPLMRLRQHGIWIDVNTANVAEEFRDIHYNTRADALAMAQADGRPVFVDYDGFQAAQVDREVYARVRKSPQAAIRLHNLKGQPIELKMVLGGALMAPSATYANILRLDGKLLAEFTWTSGMLQKHEVPDIILPPGEHTLSWETRGRPSAPVQALCILNLDFFTTDR